MVYRMTTSDAIDARTAAVRALLDLAACLPFAWEWHSVPTLRLAVSEEASSAQALVSTDDGWYVAEMVTGEKPVRLARVGHPGEAAVALAHVTVAVVPS